MTPAYRDGSLAGDGVGPKNPQRRHTHGNDRRDVMTHGVETATSSQMLQEAAQMMRTGDFGSIPVVDAVNWWRC